LSETVLGFDVGARRIGVAVGNDLIRRAQRAAVVDADVADGGIAAIAKLVDEWRPERLVVGVPLPEEPDRTKSPSLARCERFAEHLGERFRLPVERVDERDSSIEADDLHRERRRAGVARRAKSIDDVAAEIILQRYFDGLPA
jgi:putative Holliday junction resolvase